LITKELYKKHIVLFEPDSYKKATREEKEKVCNGCGSSRSKFDFVPDSLLGLNINKCCCIHDWMYEFGKTVEHKNEADRIFLNNMIRTIDRKIDQYWWMKKLRKRLAKKYYIAVKYFGGSAFWDNKDKKGNK